MKHSAAGALAAARSDPEYVRDHFDCSVPYLHQQIWLLAEMQKDESAKTTAMERLKVPRGKVLTAAILPIKSF
jgi:hypothetical protein